MHKAFEWDDLRLVQSIAQARSLSGAARALGITHSTVFRRLNAVETRIGVRLFERFRDGYTPTPAGETAAALASRFAEEVAHLERKLSGQDLRPWGTVRLTTTDTLAALLMPHVAGMRAAHPDIRLEIVVSNAMANLTRREADIALRPIGAPPDALVGRRIADIAHAVYGAPKYLSRHRGVDSDAHAWIGLDDALSATAIAVWMRQHLPQVPFACRVDALPALRDAACAGLGLAVLPCYVGDATSGLRRAAVKLPPGPRAALWLLTHEDLRRTARIRATMDFLANAFAGQRRLLEGKARVTTSLRG